MRWRRRRRRITTGIVAGIALVAVVVAIVVVAVIRSAEEQALPADGAVVSASSAEPGHPATQAVNRSTQPSPTGWRADRQTVGAWIQLAWATGRRIQSVTIRRPALNEPGVTAGYLTFGGGSAIQVRLSSTSPTTVVPVTPRITRSIRFTASTVADGASATALSLFDVDGSGATVTTDPGAAAGPAATVTQSPAGDPAALTDGTVSDNGVVWAQPDPGGSTIDLRWSSPRELAAIEIVGADDSGATVRSATARFSDGTALRIGAVPADSTIPTTIAFMPRVITSLRLSIDKVDGSGPLRLAEVRLWERGATAAGAQPVTTGGVTVGAPAAGSCSGAGDGSVTSGLVVACPAAGSRVGDSQDLVVEVASGYDRVEVDIWPAAGNRSEPTITTTASPRTVVPLRIGRLPAGPVTVRVTATGGDAEPAVARLQLMHGAATSAEPLAASSAGERTLVWDEEFDSAASISRTGAGTRYTAAKPETTGVTDFGDAIFGDPAAGLGNIGVLDDRYLRMTASSLPAGYADPQGWGRTSVGAILASARPGGSGFSAQYGTFEARMLVTAMPGTWPSFWLLPSTNLIDKQPAVAELDAIELYGHDPVGGCSSTHEYVDGKDGGIAQCGQRFASDQQAARWHTYGVRVTPTSIMFTIDGKIVATAPQVRGGGDPLFFLADLALGGGYRVDLAPAGGSAQVLVDWVRVYV